MIQTIEWCTATGNRLFRTKAVALARKTADSGIAIHTTYRTVNLDVETDGQLSLTLPLLRHDEEASSIYVRDRDLQARNAEYRGEICRQQRVQAA